MVGLWLLLFLGVFCTVRGGFVDFMVLQVLRAGFACLLLCAAACFGFDCCCLTVEFVVVLLRW